MSDTTWWYLARSSGLVSWVLLTLTLLAGTLVSGRMTDRRGARRWLLDLHPFLAGLGLAAMVLHLVAAVADTTIGLGWIDTVAPFTSAWNPLGITFGVLAVWALAAVEVTSLARRHLSRRTWRGVHLFSYLAAWTLTLHAALSGTDLRNPLVAGLALGIVTVTTVVTVRRALVEPRLPTGTSRARPVDAASPTAQEATVEPALAGGGLVR